MTVEPIGFDDRKVAERLNSRRLMVRPKEAYQFYFQSFTGRFSWRCVALWWNFSLMRKNPVELQLYEVSNFSLMGYEIP
jgi:hypothetical protein